MSNSLLHASRIHVPESARLPFYRDVPYLAERYSVFLPHSHSRSLSLAFRNSAKLYLLTTPFSLNTLPSLGYWATSVAALFSHLGIADGRSSASLYIASRNILALSRRFALVS